MSNANAVSTFSPTWERSTLTAVFASRAEARHIIDALRAFGLRDDQIGVAMRDPRQQAQFIDDTGTHAADGAANAVVVAAHGIVYRLLATVRSIRLPGRPTLAAAPGGLSGALRRMQIPEARQRESDYRRGSVLVSAKVFEGVVEAQGIMQAHGGGMLDQPKRPTAI